MESEQLEKNWNTFDSLCRRLSDHNLNKLLDELGQRLVMCPASPRTDGPGCYPGGLVERALQVTSSMRKLNDALGFEVPVASILKVGLLHEIGKVGDLEGDHFLDQDSDWHREKLGQYYKYNEDLAKMGYSHRTLFLLQHYGVSLSRDEWEAILTGQGLHLEENRFYAGTKSNLTRLLAAARLLTV